MRISVRMKLIVTTALLGLLLVAMSATMVVDRLAILRAERRSADINEVSDLLLESAGALAVERGTSNSVLGNPAGMTEAQRKTIADKRIQADRAFGHAIRRIEASEDFSPLASLLATAQRAHGAVDALRRRVDRVLDGRGPDSDDTLAHDWFPGISQFIMDSQALRQGLESLVGDGAPKGTLVGLAIKHALWEASEFAGRERGFVGGVIARGKALAPAQMETMMITRGRIVSAWAIVQARRGDLSPEFAAAVDQVQALYFGAFDALRRQVYDASTAASPYPVSGADWFRQATAGIERILEAQKIATRDVARDLNDHITADSWSLAMTILGLAVALLTLGTSAWVIVDKVIRPLRAITATMRRLAAGDKSLDIPMVDRHDEVGDMAQSVQVFKDQAIEAERLTTARQEELQRQEERRIRVHQLTTGFDDSVHAIIAEVSRFAGEVRERAAAMAADADQTAGQSAAVADATVQLGETVHAIAGFTAELSASIDHIGGKTNESATIANAAVIQADRANAQVRSLVGAAEAVDQVVNLISAIASQTNLLALNATIEAARAGDAGKGFAVVASEVKDLASQTAKATKEITVQIQAIQQATGEAARSIRDVGEVIGRIFEIGGNIAGAVRQQSAAAETIAHNVRRAANTVDTVSANIQTVRGAADQTGDRARHVTDTVQSLGSTFNVLDARVRDFLAQIKTA